MKPVYVLLASLTVRSHICQKDLDFTHFRDGSLPYGSGHPLWFVYAAWIAVIVILYFPCRWYARYKATHKKWLLSYI